MTTVVTIESSIAASTLVKGNRNTQSKIDMRKQIPTPVALGDRAVVEAFPLLSGILAVAVSAAGAAAAPTAKAAAGAAAVAERPVHAVAVAVRAEHHVSIVLFDCRARLLRVP